MCKTSSQLTDKVVGSETQKINHETKEKQMAQGTSEPKAKGKAMSKKKSDVCHELDARLLALGGKHVDLEPDSYERLFVSRHARVFDPEGLRFVSGKVGSSHASVAAFFALDQVSGSGEYDIVTGYALGEGDTWVRHSWLWDGERIVETGARHAQYYGVLLLPATADLFLHTELIYAIPDYGERCEDQGGIKDDQMFILSGATSGG
jgi:hypothetical protein